MNFHTVNRYWQSSTLFIAPILIVVLIWFRPSMEPYQWLMWLHLPLLMLHEAEEYVLAPMSFQQFFNLKTAFGSGTDPDYPLDDSYVFQVNIVLAWPVIILGAILAPVAPWLGFSMIWFELVINNVMHTILFQGDKPTYNPGLVTNCLLLLPFGTWTLLTAAGFFTPLDWALSIILGLGIAAFFGTKTRGRLARLKTMQAHAVG